MKRGALVRDAYEAFEAGLARGRRTEVGAVYVDGGDAIARWRIVFVVEEIGQVGVAMYEAFLVHVDEEMHEGEHQVVVAVGLFSEDAYVGVAAEGGDEIALMEKSVGVYFYARYWLGGVDVKLHEPHAEDVGAAGFARTYEGVVETLEEERGLEAFHYYLLIFYSEDLHFVAPIVDKVARVVKNLWDALDEWLEMGVAWVDFNVHDVWG